MFDVALKHDFSSLPITFSVAVADAQLEFCLAQHTSAYRTLYSRQDAASMKYFATASSTRSYNRAKNTFVFSSTSTVRFVEEEQFAIIESDEIV